MTDSTLTDSTLTDSTLTENSVAGSTSGREPYRAYGLEAVGRHEVGGLLYTEHLEVTDPATTIFADLYEETFAALRTRAIARQVLHREEFVEEMGDRRISKFVAWSPEGEPIGMSTLTRDLSAIPWISPEYFAARFPDHAARNALYYLGFTLVRQDQRMSRIYQRLIEIAVQRLVDDRAVCGYDVCGWNNSRFRLSSRIESILRRVSDVAFDDQDSQTYYVARFDDEDAHRG